MTSVAATWRKAGATFRSDAAEIFLAPRAGLTWRMWFRPPGRHGGAPAVMNAASAAHIIETSRQFVGDALMVQS